MNTYFQQIIFGVFFVMLFAAVPVSAQTVVECARVNRNLSIGMSGADVKMIQEMLNKDPRTELAEHGVGSPGSETIYFGQLTKAAVIKFQNIYQSEVLAPAGLTRGSGFVGAFTRAKILALCGQLHASVIPGSISAPASSSTPAPAVTPIAPSGRAIPTTAGSSALSLPVASSFKSDVPVLMFSSTRTSPRGGAVDVFGVGMAPFGNIVHLDNYTVASTTTASDGTVSFIVPNDVPLGSHSLWVSSSKGETNKTFFIVVDPKATPPVIISVTPEKGFQGTTVTVVGSGFLPTGNTIHISYGLIENISSADGKTMQFSVSPPVPLLNPGEDRHLNLSVPLWFYVANGNGVSAPIVFYLTV